MSRPARLLLRRPQIAAVEPYLGLVDTQSGVRISGDGRAYFPIAERIVLAGRMQVGTVFGPDLRDIPNDFRLYSGGGGTVRGQDYQSLGVDLGGGVESGGKSFAAVSAEVRANVFGNVSLVGFFDMGYVAEDSLFSGSGRSHSGAGIGVRYATGIGPIRLDLAVPVDGPGPADDIYAYIGIGQAF
ncbi:MAG: BamA/TamA family outer membrane protein [Pseudomonadota bacterium]